MRRHFTRSIQDTYVTLAELLEATPITFRGYHISVTVGKHLQNLGLVWYVPWNDANAYSQMSLAMCILAYLCSPSGGVSWCWDDLTIPGAYELS